MTGVCGVLRKVSGVIARACGYHWLFLINTQSENIEIKLQLKERVKKDEQIIDIYFILGIVFTKAISDEQYIEARKQRTRLKRDEAAS
jgi:hypothetical protein